VEEGLMGEIEDPFEAVKWQQVLGGEGFLRQLIDYDRNFSPETGRRLATTPDLSGPDPPLDRK
jgi:hypothetical protein